MSKKKVTKADLDKTLRQLGFKEGDDLPSAKSNDNASTQDTEGGESEGGEDNGEGGNGGNNPPHKPPFKKP